MILHNTVSMVIEKDGKFLLIKRGNPPERNYWAVPAGHVKEGETNLHAARRESREEVGSVEITTKRPVFAFVHDIKLGHRHRAHVFLGKARGRIRAASDAKKFGWFTLNQMKRMNLTHFTKKIINKLYAKVL